MNHNKKLSGQSAIVTGGSSGIGKGVALGLAQAGAKVVVNYFGSEDKAKAVVEEITSGGGEAIAVKADVSQEDQVLNLFQQTLDQFQTLDILVANAGMERNSAFAEMTLEDWKRVIEVNLTGQFLCVREAVRQFLKQGIRSDISCAAGKIICMSSVHQTIPWAGHVNYAASKGGIAMMMMSVAQEVAEHKIRVNAIAPGAIQTPINRDAWETEEALNALLKLIPYGRIGQIEDIAKATVWLASDDSDYVNGTTLTVDGGMELYPEFRGNG